LRTRLRESGDAGTAIYTGDELSLECRTLMETQINRNLTQASRRMIGAICSSIHLSRSGVRLKASSSSYYYYFPFVNLVNSSYHEKSCQPIPSRLAPIIHSRKLISGSEKLRNQLNRARKGRCLFRNEIKVTRNVPMSSPQKIVRFGSLRYEIDSLDDQGSTMSRANLDRLRQWIS
jgi:hypothetical protein